MAWWLSWWLLWLKNQGQLIVIKGHLKKKILFLSRPKIEGGAGSMAPSGTKVPPALKKLLTRWTFVILTLSFHCPYESDIWIKETIYIQTAYPCPLVFQHFSSHKQSSTVSEARYRLRFFVRVGHETTYVEMWYLDSWISRYMDIQAFLASQVSGY